MVINYCSMLSDEFGCEGPRLDHDKLCRLCVANRARLISLEFKMNRDQQFLASQKPPSDGTGFWVGKRSFMRWKTLGKLALENKIIKEVAEWKTEEMNIWRAAQGRKRKFVKDPEDNLCLDDLKAKLLRMGTNVSIATTDSKSENSAVAGISLIKNQEYLKLTNPSVAESKVNTTSDEDKKVKPSCAVKPMLKGPKPTANVKPFIKTEGLVDVDKSDGLDVKENVPISTVPSSSVITQSSNSASCSESRSSSRSSSLDSDPSQETSACSEVSSRETSGGESPDTTSPLPPYQQPSEDDFNADIVCPHGNLRIEQRVRQLISREAWSRLNSYFDKPITFQFGTPNCSVCEQELNEANLLKEKWREEAAKQKAKLPDLFKVFTLFIYLMLRTIRMSVLILKVHLFIAP